MRRHYHCNFICSKRVLHPGGDPKYKELMGSQVLQFGTRSVDEVMKALDGVISRDNELWPSQLAPYHMRSLPLLSALGLVRTLRDRSAPSRR